MIRENAENGETGAVDFARRELQQEGCEAVLIIPGDMPLVRAEDVEAVLGQVPVGARRPTRFWCRPTIKLGTNALLLAPPDVIPAALWS